MPSIILFIVVRLNIFISLSPVVLSLCFLHRCADLDNQHNLQSVKATCVPKAVSGLFSGGLRGWIETLTCIRFCAWQKSQTYYIKVFAMIVSRGE
jgi:hypothetical protein